MFFGGEVLGRENTCDKSFFKIHFPLVFWGGGGEQVSHDKAKLVNLEADIAKAVPRVLTRRACENSKTERKLGCLSPSDLKTLAGSYFAVGTEDSQIFLSPKIQSSSLFKELALKI